MHDQSGGIVPVEAIKLCVKLIASFVGNMTLIGKNRQLKLADIDVAVIQPAKN